MDEDPEFIRLLAITAAGSRPKEEEGEGDGE